MRFMRRTRQAHRHPVLKRPVHPGTLLVNPPRRAAGCSLPENVDVFEECPVMRIEAPAPA